MRNRYKFITHLDCYVGRCSKSSLPSLPGLKFIPIASGLTTIYRGSNKNFIFKQRLYEPERQDGGGDGFEFRDRP